MTIATSRVASLAIGLAAGLGTVLVGVSSGMSDETNREVGVVQTTTSQGDELSTTTSTTTERLPTNTTTPTSADSSAADDDELPPAPGAQAPPGFTVDLGCLGLGASGVADFDSRDDFVSTVRSRLRALADSEEPTIGEAGPEVLIEDFGTKGTCEDSERLIVSEAPELWPCLFLKDPSTLCGVDLSVLATEASELCRVSPLKREVTGVFPAC